VSRDFRGRAGQQDAWKKHTREMHVSALCDASKAPLNYQSDDFIAIADCGAARCSIRAIESMKSRFPPLGRCAQLIFSATSRLPDTESARARERERELQRAVRRDTRVRQETDNKNPIDRSTNPPRWGYVFRKRCTPAIRRGPERSGL